MKKRLLSVFLVMIMAIVLVACGSSADGQSAADESVPDTIAYNLRTQFREEIKADNNIENVAGKLIENPCFSELAMGTMPVEEGYLNGFNEEIKGFKSGVMFAPMIGTIPFVGYIFETDDADTLVSVLEEKSMLNWNICTTADEKVIDTQGKFVYFVMAPKSFEMEE